MWPLVRCIFGRAPMADAMENCQKGMLVDAIAMLSRFHGTMGLSRSSRMIFQPSATCGNLKWEPSAPQTRVASIVRMRLHCVQVVHLLKLADMPDRVDGHAKSFHSMCQQVVLPADSTLIAPAHASILHHFSPLPQAGAHQHVLDEVPLGPLSGNVVHHQVTNQVARQQKGARLPDRAARPHRQQPLPKPAHNVCMCVVTVCWHAK